MKLLNIVGVVSIMFFGGCEKHEVVQSIGVVDLIDTTAIPPIDTIITPPSTIVGIHLGTLERTYINYFFNGDKKINIDTIPYSIEIGQIDSIHFEVTSDSLHIIHPSMKITLLPNDTLFMYQYYISYHTWNFKINTNDKQIVGSYYYANVPTSTGAFAKYLTGRWKY